MPNRYNTPRLKVYTNERVYFRGRRVVRNGIIACFYKKFTAKNLSKFNNIYLYVYELSNGDFYAQTRNGNYVFKLTKIQKPADLPSNYLNYLRSLK